MRVVLLSYYFPPDQAVGALRPAKVASSLRAAGHQVSVITARIPGVTRDQADVTRVRPIPNPREGWLALKSLIRGAPTDRSRGSADPSVAGGAPASPNGLTLKRWLNSLVWLPDDRQGFVIPGVAAGLNAIRDGADLIYTSAPPFSTHLAGLMLKRLTGIRWVAEFRDPWTDNPWKPPHVRSRFSDSVERGLECMCMDNADLIVCVSSGIASALDRKVRRITPTHPRTIVVRNGIDRIAPRPSPNGAAMAAARTLRIVHVGTFYQQRDPGPFLSGLASVRAAIEARGTRMQVDLVGDCRWYNEISIEAMVRRLGLSDVVTFRDWVPHSTAIELVEQADMLLLLAQGQPTQVPNKLYEYLGTRRPIVAFVDEHGESAALLRQVGGHFVITDGSIESAADALVRASGHAAGTVNEAFLQELTSASQMRRLVTALESEGTRGVG